MSSPLPLFTGEKFKITTLHKKISINKSNYTSLAISWCPLMASLTFSQNSSFIRKHKILVGHAYRFNNNNTDKNKYCTSFLHWGWRSYVIICSVCHSVCLSVCLSVSNITAEVISRFHGNLELCWGLPMGTTGYVLVVIWSWIQIPDHFSTSLTIVE